MDTQQKCTKLGNNKMCIGPKKSTLSFRSVEPNEKFPNKPFPFVFQTQNLDPLQKLEWTRQALSFSYHHLVL